MADRTERIIEKIKQGCVAKEIAEAEGCSSQHVRNIAKRNQLELRRNLRLNSVKYPVLVRLMKEEFVTGEDMGKAICLCGEAVRQRLRKGWSFPEEDKKAIQAAFFPEVPVDKLFGSEDDQSY